MSLANRFRPSGPRDGLWTELSESTPNPEVDEDPLDHPSWWPSEIRAPFLARLQYLFALMSFVAGALASMLGFRAGPLQELIFFVLGLYLVGGVAALRILAALGSAGGRCEHKARVRRMAERLQPARPRQSEPSRVSNYRTGAIEVPAALLRHSQLRGIRWFLRDPFFSLVAMYGPFFVYASALGGAGIFVVTLGAIAGVTLLLMYRPAQSDHDVFTAFIDWVWSQGSKETGRETPHAEVRLGRRPVIFYRVRLAEGQWGAEVPSLVGRSTLAGSDDTPRPLSDILTTRDGDMSWCRLVSFLSPRRMGLLMEFLANGGEIRGGWAYSRIYVNPLLDPELSRLRVQAELGRAIFEEVRTLGESDEHALVEGWVREITSVDDLDRLAKAIRGASVAEAELFALAWTHACGTGRRRAELLPLLAEDTRVELACDLLSVSEFAEVRADAVIALSALAPDQANAAIKTAVSTRDVQLFDELAARLARSESATRWAASLFDEDCPTWATVPYARMLSFDSNADSVDKALRLLQGPCGYEGRALEHVRALKVSANGDLASCAEALEREILTTLGDGSGSLSLSASAGAGDLSIKSTESAERSLEHSGQFRH